MRTNQRRIIVYVLAVALVITTVAYATMQTVLNVSGVVVKKGASLDIYFDNLQTPVLHGQGKSNSTSLSSTTFDFTIELSEPNDSVTYYFDVVNDDKVNAKLEEVNVTGLNELSNRNISYYFYYSDSNDVSVKAGDYLAAGTRKQLKLKIEYDNVDSIYADDKNLKLSIKLIYMQYDGDIPSGGGDGGTTDNIIAICNNGCAASGNKCLNSELNSDIGVKCSVTLASYPTMAEDEVKNFYVIADDGTNVTMLSAEPLTYSYYSRYLYYGNYYSYKYPSTALENLESLSNWYNKLPQFTYNFSEPYNYAGNNVVYEAYPYDITASVRLPNIEDFVKLLGLNSDNYVMNYNLPAWAASTDGGYWLSSVRSHATNATEAEIGNYYIYTVSGNSLANLDSLSSNYDVVRGIRGVIVLPKSYIS